jgi:hypothetical protein
VQIYWISSHGQPTMWGPPAWGLGEGLTTPHHKGAACYVMLHRASGMVGSCEHSNEPLGFIKCREFD